MNLTTKVTSIGFHPSGAYLHQYLPYVLSLFTTEIFHFVDIQISSKLSFIAIKVRLSTSLRLPVIRHCSPIFLCIGQMHSAYNFIIILSDCALAQSLTHFHSFTHSLSLTHPFIHSLTFTHSLFHSLTFRWIAGYCIRSEDRSDEISALAFLYCVYKLAHW